MFKIISPATSANLASGFDSFGICFNIANEILAEEFQDAIIVNNHGDTLRNKENLIVKSFFYGCETLGYKPKGLKLNVRSSIPVARGLGSSASCINAGVTAAYLISGNKVNKSEIFEISTLIEGHPDNIAPNIFGGASISYRNGKEFKAAKFNVADKFSFITIIPEYRLSTSKARSVLPETYSREDCVYNISHASILTLALISGNESLLRDALHDKLHQPYRSVLIENYEKIIKICMEHGALGCYLSGAGPTMVAVSTDTKTVGKLRKAFSDERIQVNVFVNKINRKGLEYFAL